MPSSNNRFSQYGRLQANPERMARYLAEERKRQQAENLRKFNANLKAARERAKRSREK